MVAYAVVKLPGLVTCLVWRLHFRVRMFFAKEVLPYELIEAAGPLKTSHDVLVACEGNELLKDAAPLGGDDEMIRAAQRLVIACAGEASVDVTALCSLPLVAVRVTPPHGRVVPAGATVTLQDDQATVYTFRRARDHTNTFYPEQVLVRDVSIWEMWSGTVFDTILQKHGVITGYLRDQWTMRVTGISGPLTVELFVINIIIPQRPMFMFT